MKYKDREGESHASRSARLGPSRKLTKAPPKQSSKSNEISRETREEEETSSRSNSWSSHGHVEL